MITAATEKLLDMAAAGQPFVLLDDARENGAVPARLFTDPVEFITATNGQNIDAFLAVMDSWQATGAWAAGWLGYEAGLALEPRLAEIALPTPSWPMAWFARFASMERVPANMVPMLLPDSAGATMAQLEPAITFDAYQRAAETVLAAIRAGDIYQANLTFNATVTIHGDPLALYAALRQTARSGYGALVFTGTHWLLSLSPELFFSRRNSTLIARPMKGTATRQRGEEADRAAAFRLRSDPKQQAENLMIVDLIRNDMSRVSIPGSVNVTDLFRVESYPTVHQMVSEITAELRPDVTISDVLKAAFPCGSIIGAPKGQAALTIAGVEREPRNAYTGSIGFLGPNDEAAFNVGIRTLALPAAIQSNGARLAKLGLGSGIVADSSAANEWRECLAKGEFVVQASQARFDLIETIAFEPHEGMPLLNAHLQRLSSSAAILGFRFDRHELRNRLQHATFRRDSPARVRVRLSPDGFTAIEVSDVPFVPRKLRVALTKLPVSSEDIRLRHKTSDRAFYEAARASSGADEVIFVLPDGHVSEGSFTSVFVERDGVFLTPPPIHAQLAGVLQQSMLADGRAKVAPLTADDLHHGLRLGNALRGLMMAELV